MQHGSTWPDASNWTVRYSDQFLKQARSRRYRSLATVLRSRLEALFEDPFNAASAERLRHEFRGLRSARIDARLRLIYRLCGECRDSGHAQFRPIECCWSGDTEDCTINLLCISDHYRNMPTRFDFSAT